MLDLYGELFDRLHRRGIGHCAWKSLTEVAPALDGRGDLDLYVRADGAAAFRATLHECGFVLAHSPYRYPGSEHWYGHDPACDRPVHLHLYFRLTTGESHLKQFQLPVEALLDEVPPGRGGHGLHELHPELAWRLYRFRRCIKVSCLPGALLQWRERRGDAAERDHLSRLRAEVVGPQPAFSGWLAEVDPVERGGLSDLRLGLAYRVRFAHLSRFGVLDGFVSRYAHLVVRPVNKLLGRRKRLGRGVIVGVTGLDGSGKSTAVEMLSRWLSRDFEVVRVHYGHGRTTLATLPVRAALALRGALRRRLAGGEVVPTRSASDTRGLVAHVRYLALAWERRSVAARALRAASRGAIVISDRWYSLDTGRMDSPRLDPASGSTLLRWMARLEHEFYRTSPDPDLLLAMRVDPQLAVARNRARDKPGKETDAEILDRFASNADLRYRVGRLVEIDNARDMHVVHAELRECVWRSLAQTWAPLARQPAPIVDRHAASVSAVPAGLAVAPPVPRELVGEHGVA